MSKMTRNNLKSLVKECLFEILLESTDTGEGTNISEAKASTARRSVRGQKQKTRRPALDNIRTAVQPTRDVPPPLDVSQITSDPIMTAIFQDTASTTLVEQADAERGKAPKGRGDAATLAAAQSDPSQLFGAAAQNWAALAFNDK
jgi:hypothetical protein